MGSTLSTLAPPAGAKRKTKRLGRGPGSGQGTTAGRGQKGQRARSSSDVGRGFEGGQMPLQRRLPKRGFKNAFRVEYAPVNLDRLAEMFPVGSEVTPEILKERGAVPKRAHRIKVLGEGEIGHALTVRAHGFSKSAEAKITAAGGAAITISAKTGAAVSDAGSATEA